MYLSTGLLVYLFIGLSVDLFVVLLVYWSSVGLVGLVDWLGWWIGLGALVDVVEWSGCLGALACWCIGFFFASCVYWCVGGLEESGVLAEW